MDIALIGVEDADAAVREHFLGSPTIRVDGEDVEPGPPRAQLRAQLSAFVTALGSRGTPADEWEVAALHRQHRA